MILNTNTVHWTEATKTRGLRAKRVTDLISPEIISSVLLKTLEGHAVVDPQNMVCVGPAGDIWQQPEAGLRKKYNITGLDKDGWLLCNPKPENSVECFEVTEWQASRAKYVQGIWGSDVPDVGQKLQAFSPGDFICRKPDDHADQWVVRRKLFLNTYELIK